MADSVTVEHHPFPDSAFVIVTVPAPDSTAHVNWLPALVTISTSTGYTNDFQVVPYVCIKPRNVGHFPFNFEWRSCNQIAVGSSEILSVGELSAIEADITGHMYWWRARKAGPGADYLFLVPVGEQATEEAARRAGTHGHVSYSVVPSDDPICVRSDDYPPPPCPPWVLQAQIPFAFGPGSPDTLSVEPGGWVHLKYADDKGIEHAADYQVPPV